MSLVPEFELGLWNAWIFTLYLIFSNVLPYVLSGKLIDKEVWKKATAADVQFSKTEKKVSNIISLLFYALIAYSFFLPFRLGTIWLYVGARAQRGLPYFKKPHVPWYVLDIHRHRNSLCLLGFSAVNSDFDGPDTCLSGF